MLTWPAGTKVFVCTRATDMRCGFDTLAAQVTRFLAAGPAVRPPVRVPESPGGPDQGPVLGHRRVRPVV